MALHAVQDLDDAFAATRGFLTPLSVRRVGKLAVVVFFIGAGMNVPTTSFDTSVPSDQTPEPAIPGTLPDDALLFAGLAVAIVVLFALVWGLVGAIMEFVFVESLRTGEVAIRRYWSARWRQGMRLLAFRITIGLPVLTVFLGWLVLVFGPMFIGGFDPVTPVAVLILGIPLLFVGLVAFAVVYGFTTAFVVPIMILEDSGVVAGWRRLWPSLRAKWKQYLAYAVASVVLTFALGLLVSVLLGLVAIVLLIPLAGIGVLLYAVGSLSSPVGLFVLGSLVVLFVLVMAVLWALAQVPVVTYLRYYALLVLGDVDESLDLIPDRRARIRREEGTTHD